MSFYLQSDEHHRHCRECQIFNSDEESIYLVSTNIRNGICTYICHLINVPIQFCIPNDRVEGEWHRHMVCVSIANCQFGMRKLLFDKALRLKWN